MKRINLLPGEERTKARRERGIIYTLLGLVLLVLVLGAAYVWQDNRVSEKNADLSTLNNQIDFANVQVTGLTPYSVLETQRTAMMKSAKDIYNSRITWSSIMQELSLVIPDDVRLQSFVATVPATMLPGTGASTAATQAGADVTLSGQAQSHVSVAVFMTRLGLLPQLTNVNLSDSQEVRPTNEPPYVNYTITASLRTFLTPPPVIALAGAGQ
jgi:Tfp pilus assembly protein PilN